MQAYAGLPGAQCNRPRSFGATSHVAYDALGPAGIDDLLGQVEAAQSSGLKEAGISIDALGGKVRDLAPDATAFVHRGRWRPCSTPRPSPRARPAADAYVRGFRAAMLPHWGDHAYVNYADPTISDYRAAYSGANADRLAQVRAAYDPDGFFSQPQDF